MCDQISSHKPAEMRHSSNTCKLIQESPPAPRREAFSLFMALQSGSQTSSCLLPSSSTSWWHPNPVPPTPPWCLDPWTHCPAARSNVLCLSAHPHPTSGTDPASSPAPGAGCATSFLGHWLPPPPAPCTFWVHAASSGPQHPQLDVFSIALSLCAELGTPCQRRSGAEHEAQDSPHLEYPWGRQDGAGQGRMLHPAACVLLVHVLPVPHLSCWLSSSAQGEELGDIQLSPRRVPSTSRQRGARRGTSPKQMGRKPAVAMPSAPQTTCDISTVPFIPRAPRQAARRGKPQHCAGGAEGGCTVPKSAGQGGHPCHFCIAPALPCTPVPFLLPPCQQHPLQQWVPLLPPPSSPAVTAELTGRQAACLGDYLDVIFLNKLDEVYLIKHSCHYNTQA